MLNVPMQFIRQKCVLFDSKRMTKKIDNTPSVHFDFMLNNIAYFEKTKIILNEVYGGYSLSNKEDLKLIVPNYVNGNINTVKSLEENKRLKDVDLPPRNKLKTNN